MLDMNQVAYFVEVVHAGSFAKAGRRLGLPSNTLSRHIQRLESFLGCRLLQRSTRKLALTTAGQALFDRSSGAVGELRQVGRDLNLGNEIPGGLVRVTAPIDFFEAFTANWVNEFLAVYPRVSLQFLLNDAMVDLIADGIDLAFRAGPVKNSSAVARKIVNLQFRLVASPAYLAAAGTPTTLSSLKKHSCVTLVSQPGPVLWCLNGPEGPAEVRVSGRFSANTAGAALHATLAGIGIALLPDVMTAPEIRAGRLVNLLRDYKRDGGGLYAVMPSRRQIPRAVSAFVAFASKRIDSSLRA